jgi:hypothetical protein
VSANRRHRTAPRFLGPLALVASLALVLVVVQVPPCGMSAEACAVAARPALGAHCPMAAAMAASSAMDCCFEDAAPSREPAPAAPAPADDLRVQLKAPAPTVSLVSGLVASLPSALPARGAAATPAAPGTPLYTLLSTLLI